MTLAILLPLGTLTALGLLVYPPAWLSHLAFPSLTAAQANDDPLAPVAVESRSSGPGQRAAADREMQYEGNGRAFLGKYDIQLHDPATGLTLRVKFALHGATACPDARTFARWVATHHCLLREQVMVAVRDSEQADLVEPTLDRVGHRLVTQVNRMLERAILAGRPTPGILPLPVVRQPAFRPVGREPSRRRGSRRRGRREPRGKPVEWERVAPIAPPSGCRRHKRPLRLASHGRRCPATGRLFGQLCPEGVGNHVYSPITLTSTRLGRRPSNSP